MEEKYKGNCAEGKMNTTGWNNMVKGFKERTGWSHSKDQLKYRCTTLKKWYNGLKKLQSCSGSGRNEGGGFKAAKHVWDDLKKVCCCMACVVLWSRQCIALNL
jgi:hypothetical protein